MNGYHFGAVGAAGAAGAPDAAGAAGAADLVILLLKDERTVSKQGLDVVEYLLEELLQTFQPRSVKKNLYKPGLFAFLKISAMLHF